MKQRETPEERKARKTAEREAKRLKELKEQGWEDTYTNANNPFGDPNLHEKFSWIKKREQGKEQGLSDDEIKAREKARKEENRRELEKVKKR